MVASRFESILKDLEPFFHCRLEPDQNNACLIKLNNAGGIEIQLELDRSGDHLLMGCRVGPIPPGRYRENVFKEALKSNHLYPHSRNIFGYSRKSDLLIVYALCPINETNSEKIIEILPPFIHQARTWTEALNRGEVPSFLTTSPTHQGGGLFGLIR
jgi:hypothetical protein